MLLTDVQYHYVAVDCDHDISADTMEITLTPDDSGSWVTADYEASAPPAAVQFPAAKAGLTRYWWRVLVGAGEDLEPTEVGRVVLYGRLTDSPELIHPWWSFVIEEAP